MKMIWNKIDNMNIQFSEKTRRFIILNICLFVVAAAIISAAVMLVNGVSGDKLWICFTIVGYAAVAGFLSSCMYLMIHTGRK